MNENELYHHGVKGMKWGVRKKRYTAPTEASRKKKVMRDARINMHKARIDKKNAQTNYSKTYDQALRLPNQFGAKSKAYDKAIVETAKKANAADKAYRQAKRDYKQSKRDYNEQKTIDKYKKHGLEYNLDTAINVHNYGYKAAKRIEDRIANQKMSRLKSESIELGRSMVTTSLATVSTIAAIGLVSSVAGRTPSYSVLDAAGKTIKNFY